jgi:hypothetical protein
MTGQENNTFLKVYEKQTVRAWQRRYTISVTAKRFSSTIA